MRPAMKTLLLAAVLVTPALSLAEPTPAAPPKAEKPAKLACEAKGTPIFEIDRKTTPDPKWLQSVRLYATGAWSFQETTADGKPGKADAGCLGKDETKALTDELAAAKWKITKAKIRCMAISPNFTVYKAHGKQVFESHTCDGQILDEPSRKLLDDAEKQLAVAFPK
jgi:hypothetical protein